MPELGLQIDHHNSHILRKRDEEAFYSYSSYTQQHF